jgi:small GTP-binding protein
MEKTSTKTGKKKIRQIKKKICVIGEGGVGKTTLLYRYVNKIFKDSTKMTIGSDFFTKRIITVDDDYENHLTFLLWDFAGQKRFRFIFDNYIEGAEGILLVFELVRVNSLLKLYDWIETLKKGKVWQNSGVKFILVGTKKDLLDGRTNPRMIPKKTIDKFQQDFGIEEYYETSSLNGEGIEPLFRNLAYSMIKQEKEKGYPKTHNSLKYPPSTLNF